MDAIRRVKSSQVHGLHVPQLHLFGRENLGKPVGCIHLLKLCLKIQGLFGSDRTAPQPTAFRTLPHLKIHGWRLHHEPRLAPAPQA